MMDRNPNECAHAARDIKLGESVKTLCAEWDRWTNCKDVGRCVMDCAQDDGNQMTIYDILEDD